MTFVTYLFCILINLPPYVHAQFESKNHTELKSNCLHMSPEEKEELSGTFSEEQLDWFCHEMANHATIPSNLPPATRKQSAYLDFVNRCQGDECLEFAFPSDEDEKAEEANDKNDLMSKMVFGTDTRCSHPEIEWRPAFCKNADSSSRSHVKDTSIIPQPVRKRVKRQAFASKRKEYRMLTDEERKRLHLAINRLKTDTVDGMSQWDLLTTQHYPDKALGGHWGPAFLPWHREFLRQVEVALRSKDPGVALAYWDTTLDADIPNPADSIIWSPEFFGNGDEYVTSGPFAHWQALTPLEGKEWINRLYRDLGRNKLGRYLSKTDLDWTLSQSRYRDLTFCHNKRFEMSHGLSHIHVGGYMKIIKMSPNDPSFYLLHSFVDSIWERFRQLRQNSWERENDWADSHLLCNRDHAIDAPMFPFNGLTNRDGLGSQYTRVWYQYDPYPSCITSWDHSTINCGSEYLFCDKNDMRCKTKIVPGGNCTGFENQDICYRSSCYQGYCYDGYTGQRAGLNSFRQDSTNSNNRWTTTTTTTPRPTTTTTPAPTSPAPPPINYPTVFIKILVLSNNNWPMKDMNTRVEAKGVNHNQFSVSELVDYNTARSPEHPGLAYVQLRRPSTYLRVVETNITVLDRYGESCIPMCYDKSSWDQRVPFRACDGHIRLALMETESDPVAYTHSLDTRPYLDMRLMGHPDEWTLKPPYLTFSCRGERNMKYALETLDIYKPTLSPYNQFVWFWVLVVDRNAPFQNSVPDATVVVRDETNSEFVFVKNVGQTDNSINGASLPYGSGVVFLQARNPQFYNNAVDVIIKVQSGNGRECTPRCTRQSNSDRPFPCDGRVRLAEHSHDSYPNIPFTDNPDARPFIGWDMTDHPRRWINSIGHLRFDC